MEVDFAHLDYVSGPVPNGTGPLCIVLAHNEANLLPEFFDHYRGFGQVEFVAIDDRSNDGSGAYLCQQNDVLVLRPKPGSTYAKDKREWRGEVLDAFGAGRWCLALDADEHLIWRDFETRPFGDLIDRLDRHGAAALMATMVDMYADRPLADHISDPARRLADTFPLFDDPMKDPLAYRTRLSPRRFRAQFPTPAMTIQGGMRDRLFFGGARAHTGLGRRLLRGSLSRNPMPAGLLLGVETIRSRLTKPALAEPPLNNTKLPLLRWKRGLRFNGGAHHISEILPLAHERGVLMHYVFTRGEAGIRHLVERRQHAKAAYYYGPALDTLGVSPRYSGSSLFEGSASFQSFYTRNGDP